MIHDFAIASLSAAALVADVIASVFAQHVQEAQGVVEESTLVHRLLSKELESLRWKRANNLSQIKSDLQLVISGKQLTHTNTHTHNSHSLAHALTQSLISAFASNANGLRTKT